MTRPRHGVRRAGARRRRAPHPHRPWLQGAGVPDRHPRGAQARPLPQTAPDPRSGVRAGTASRFGLGACRRRFETAGWEARSDRENELDAAERLRLLDVASTRARDHLLVSLHRKGTDRLDTHAALLCEHGEGAPAAVLGLPRGAVVRYPVPQLRATGARPARSAAPATNGMAARFELLARAGRPATVAATTLAKEPEVEDPAADPGLAKDEPGDDRPAWRRGRELAGTLGRPRRARSPADGRPGDGRRPRRHRPGPGPGGGDPAARGGGARLARSCSSRPRCAGRSRGPVPARGPGRRRRRRCHGRRLRRPADRDARGARRGDDKTDQTPTDDGVDAAMGGTAARGPHTRSCSSGRSAPRSRDAFSCSCGRRAVEREAHTYRRRSPPSSGGWQSCRDRAARGEAPGRDHVLQPAWVRDRGSRAGWRRCSG